MVRKYFGTDGIRGKANEGAMTAETALRVGMAAGRVFRRGDHRHRVVIGKDTRLSGYMLEPALTAGFTSMGMDVFLFGPLPTTYRKNKLSAYHAKYFAYDLTRQLPANDIGKLTASLQDAQVDLNPHQVEAALFAFKSPLSKGAVLADEVGLGKTIEAGIILSQQWAERKRKLLIIGPSNLRKQWNRELADKFYLPSVILEAKSFNNSIKEGNLNPFNQEDTIIICSYHFAKNKAPYLKHINWDLVIIDEAHRSQYDFMDGFAKHMRDALPNASFIGFTGTPIENTDKNTQAVFGDYIDVYDIQQAVEDGATVRIFYENRLAKINLKDEEKPRVDAEFEELTESEELTDQQKLKAKWARLEAIVGNQHRLSLIAADIVKHFEERNSILDGKAMIVCMSRRICVDLYAEIIKIRPDWHSDDDAEGTIKVVMTGSSSDPLNFQPHVRNKPKRKALGDRLKDPKDSLKLAIVRDMWLTGFDAPSMHTLYIDKPMKGHNLMQAIARVNRVYKDKEGGLVVDYIGIATDLKKALSVYTESGGKGKPAFDQEEAASVMMSKYEIVAQMFEEQPTDKSQPKGFDYKSFFGLTPKEKLYFPIQAANYILGLEDGKARYTNAVTALSKSFAISVPHPYTNDIRDEVGLFQAIKARIVKVTQSSKTKSDEEIETAIKQILSDAVVADEVVDIFDAAGIKKPDISILSDEFLAEVKGMQHKNLALELLKKLLNDEIKTRQKTNIVQSKKFSEMIENAVRNYQNNLITSAQVIEELINLAKEIKEADRKGEDLGLDFREFAFYSALEVNDSAVAVLGDEILRHIARELVDTVRKNTSIDWTVRENVQAKMRIAVKKILRKHGYPPDLELKATETVIEQAKLLANEINK